MAVGGPVSMRCRVDVESLLGWYGRATRGSSVPSVFEGQGWRRDGESLVCFRGRETAGVDAVLVVMCGLSDPDMGLPESEMMGRSRPSRRDRLRCTFAVVASGADPRRN